MIIQKGYDKTRIGFEISMIKYDGVGNIINPRIDLMFQLWRLYLTIIIFWVKDK